MDISHFEKVEAQLQGLFNEITALSKKKPDDAINKFKLKFVNQIIVEANKILKQEKPFPDFYSFEEDDLPTNSDVVMILSQYISCLEKLRSDNITSNLGSWYWRVKGEQTSIKTAPPKKIAPRI
ncbi:hypothetical protein E8L90_04825 [Brevibacillus antibioticus]|uniref:Uncharacterized protein n=1 Tax=Brevibacillus antibioticus TaxID=2570228 RepID=A0A4U2Y2Z9_9BACL|nr:hypothetical protein [Brevibacillus antibioticus]TKI54818.1 hypothetical protein E8L90_04825 [Brevibacillus antibioticus]